jgi:hypothetical protein
LNVLSTLLSLSYIPALKFTLLSCHVSFWEGGGGGCSIIITTLYLIAAQGRDPVLFLNEPGPEALSRLVIELFAIGAFPVSSGLSCKGCLYPSHLVPSTLCRTHHSQVIDVTVGN